MSPFEKARKRILDLHQKEGVSWRKMAKLPEYKGIPHATLYSIGIKGIEPTTLEYRKILGLGEIITQVVYRNKGRFTKPQAEA